MANAIKNKKRLMFIKIDDDNDHRGQGEKARAQGARAAPGLRPADCGAKPIAGRERKPTGLFKSGEDSRILRNALNTLHGFLTERKYRQIIITREDNGHKTS